MSNTIEVTGAIVSKNGVTLFTAAGQSQVFGQESWRTAAILEAVLVPLAQAQATEGFGATITIDLDQFSLAKQVEKATGGALKVEERVEDGVSKVALTTASGARIEDASALEKHIDRAAIEGSSGLTRFVERFGRLTHKHTADELLKFVQKMDLPIADDGCIVVYKFLDKADGGVYVDHHTKKVRQRPGARVSMPLKNIDQSRAMCSSGLHVCSARYGNYGDTVFLAKVDPADVVAIPAQEEGKMRVSAYHLVALVDRGGHASVSDKKSLLSVKSGSELVANVIAGNHLGITEEVIVGGSHAYGNEATLEVRAPAVPPRPQPMNPVRKIEETPKIDPKSVKDKLKAATSGDMGAAITAAVEREAKEPESGGVLDGHLELLKKEAPSPAPQKPSAKAQAETVHNAARIKDGRKKEAPVATITPEYRAKLDKAQAMLKDGSTLRQVDKALGMCRKSLARHIALGNIVV